jgi:hypothetical protein
MKIQCQFHRMGLVALAAICAVTLPAAAAPSKSVEPLALKGIVIGAPADVSKLYDALGFHAHDALTNGQGCWRKSCGYGLTTIAGIPAEILLTADKASRVVDITAHFMPAFFSDIRAALHAKYGKPAESEHSIAQTSGGAKLDVIVETWRDVAGNEMTICNYADAARGFLMLQSKSEVDRWAALHAKAKGDI